MALGKLLNLSESTATLSVKQRYQYYLLVQAVWRLNGAMHVKSSAHLINGGEKEEKWEETSKDYNILTVPASSHPPPPSPYTIHVHCTHRVGLEITANK